MVFKFHCRRVKIKEGKKSYDTWSTFFRIKSVTKKRVKGITGVRISPCVVVFASNKKNARSGVGISRRLSDITRKRSDPTIKFYAKTKFRPGGGSIPPTFSGIRVSYVAGEFFRAPGLADSLVTNFLLSTGWKIPCFVRL